MDISGPAAEYLAYRPKIILLIFAYVEFEFECGPFHCLNIWVGVYFLTDNLYMYQIWGIIKSNK